MNNWFAKAVIARILMLYVLLVGAAVAGPEEPPLFFIGANIATFKVGLCIYSQRSDLFLGSIHHWFLIHWSVPVIAFGALVAGIVYVAYRRLFKIEN